MFMYIPLQCWIVSDVSWLLFFPLSFGCLSFDWIFCRLESSRIKATTPIFFILFYTFILTAIGARSIYVDEWNIK